MAGPGYMKILTKIGNRAGSIVGIGTGVGQLASAHAAKKRAMESTPEMVDPTQGAFLAELQQKKNALNTGSEYTSSLDAINDNMTQTQDVLASNSGGDAGGTVSALLKSQQVANRGQGELLAQGEQQEGLYTGLYGNLLDKIAQRKLELGMVDREQNLAEWAQKQQSGMANVTAGAQSMMDMKGSDKKAQNPMIGNTGTGSTMAAPSALNKFSLDKSGDTKAVGGAGGAATGGNAGGFLSKLKGGASGASSGGSGGGMDFSKISGLLSSFGGK